MPPAPTPPATSGTPKTTLKGVPPAQLPEEQLPEEPSAQEEEDWVVSFNDDGTVTEEHSVQSTSTSGISASRLGEKVIAKGKAKVGSRSGSAGMNMDSDGLGPGVMVYKYELIKLLGRGGMGAVYMAHDTKLGRRVAIKFLSKRISGKKKFRQRFMLEARATARLNHENIVTIYDAGEYKGQSYLVLEYLDGAPLSKILKERRLHWTQAVQYIVPVVKALAAAHEKGIVHRDLKPDNIYILKDGRVKVLDFGLAKMIGAAHGGEEQFEEQLRTATKDFSDIGKSESQEEQGLTKAGAIMGTYAYMSPEQWGAGKVDVQTDIWAVGVILFEMLTGEHPVGTRSAQVLAREVTNFKKKLRSVRELNPDIPPELDKVVSKCLEKRKDRRFKTANELLRTLESLDPSRQRGHISEIDNPYPGLATFQERDADKFFGRDSEIARFLEKLEHNALLAVIGPSGAGKSSFIRAGVIPALKQRTRQAWDVIVIRPGRDPFAGLASALLRSGSSTNVRDAAKEERVLAKRLRKEPGLLGTLLRARSRSTGHPILVFVDQFEEIFTLVSPENRQAFAVALSGAADDPSLPIRVVVAMRSDFLDRVAEHAELMDKITKDITILQTPGSEALKEALIKPAQMAGYAFEDEKMVDEMVEALKDEAAALPLLQFTASKLWDNRDRQHKILPRSVYDEMGGVAGALAKHADSVLASMTTQERDAVKRLFQRLVTSDGTRAVLMVSEITSFLGRDMAARILKKLAGARLITVQSIGEEGDAQVELIHESLITRWQTLRRWLEEDNENAAMLQQLREAAKQWEQRGRPTGLLWTGDVLEEARLWIKRYKGGLTDLEKEFLAEAFRLADKAARRKRYMLIALIVLMAMITTGAVAALIMIRGAERQARMQAVKAQQEAERALRAERELKKKMVELARETERAKRAETLATDRLKEVMKARDTAKKAEEELRKQYEELQKAWQETAEAKRKAEEAKLKAEEALAQVKLLAEKEKIARLEAENAQKRLQKLLRKEQQRVQALQALRSKIIQHLPSK